MPELVFTRRFSMGHRLIHGASESCAVPHGHNELVTVRLTATTPARLDGQG
ncbi:MAG: 6-carboxytetrahydropterin synthase, partial [Acetobacter peroxydans]|nr:6-carboxytetrahydropterin synthase [Acetobacter peroxydans]